MAKQQREVHDMVIIQLEQWEKLECLDLGV